MGKIYSMTGYATVQTQYNDSELTCEIRSVNSRYLEVAVKLPKFLSEAENHIKETIRKKVTRGKLMCNFSFSSMNNELQNIKIDQNIIKIYMDLLEQLKQSAGIESPITLDHILYFKDIFSFEEESQIDEPLLERILHTTDQTLDQLNGMRAGEGEYLRTDLLTRLDLLNTMIGEISEFNRENPGKEFERMYKRLLSMVEEDKLEQNRLEQELAILSDKVDVSEEIVRMDSHLNLFRENLETGSPIGKKLNFILQEMHREANTMANKTTMVEISHRVVTIKEEIEKLREQVQNIE